MKVPLTGIAATAPASPRLSAAAVAPKINVVRNAASTAGTSRRAVIGSLLLAWPPSTAPVGAATGGTESDPDAAPPRAERGLKEGWASADWRCRSVPQETRLPRRTRHSWQRRRTVTNLHVPIPPTTVDGKSHDPGRRLHASRHRPSAPTVPHAIPVKDRSALPNPMAKAKIVSFSREAHVV